MKRTFLLLGTAGVMMVGMIVQMGIGRSRTDDPDRAEAFSAAEHHYRQGTGTVPWSRFLRQP